MADAFGVALADCFSGKPGVHVVERTDGHLSIGYATPYFWPQAKWPEYQQQLILGARGRVLDIGCGAGRFALHLIAQGLEVIGIDISAKAVEVAKQRGVSEVRQESILNVGQAEFGAFDTILLMGNGLGLLGNPRRARWLLKRRLAPIALGHTKILLDGVDFSREELPSHRNYIRANLAGGRPAGQLRVRVRYQELATRWFDLLLLSPSELSQLVQGTGWNVLEVIERTGTGEYAAVLGLTGGTG